MIELAPGCHLLPLMPRFGINAVLADGVLFDAGIRQSAKKILRAVEGRGIKAHALTHVHPDHQGASHAVCEALGLPLWVGEGDVDAMETGQDNKSSALIALIDKGFSGPPHPVDKRLQEGDTVGRFTVVETPGHTPGHLAYWDENRRVLILGDVLTNMNLVTTVPGLHGPPPTLTVDPALNCASARKLLGLRPGVVAFGHGPPLRDPDRFEDFIRALPD